MLIIAAGTEWSERFIRIHAVPITHPIFDGIEYDRRSVAVVRCQFGLELIDKGIVFFVVALFLNFQRLGHSDLNDFYSAHLLSH